MYTNTFERGMRAAVLAAGERIRELFLSKDLDIHEKSGPGDLVTRADFEATEIALDLLKSYFPEIPVIGEESGGKPTEDKCFYLDPLDGTLNFVHGYPNFAVSLGLWKGTKPLAGIVYNPISRSLYFANLDQGAFKNGSPIRCSSKASLESSLLATGWPYDLSMTEHNARRIKKLRNLCQDVRNLGSAALSLCYVAEGILDGYFEEGLDTWDLAGGAIIAQDAGAVVSDFEENIFDLKKGEIIAAGKGIHHMIAEVIRNDHS